MIPPAHPRDPESTRIRPPAAPPRSPDVTRAAIVVALLALPAAARAESSVTVLLNAQGQDEANRLGVSVPDLIERVRQKMDEIFQTSRLPSLLRSFADTGAFSDRGLGVDYQPDPGDLMFGFVATGAITSDVSLGSTSNLLGGSIVNLGVIAGANLGRWDHPRWTVFANGFRETTTIHGLDGALATAAAHVQYRILEESRPATVKWTGLVATTGLEYARWTVGTSSTLEVGMKVVGANGEKRTVDFGSVGTLTVDASTYTVPLEITTGIRLFDLLGVYAGAGLDLTAGETSIGIDLSGDLTINSDRLPIGTATITASEQGSPSPVAVHALGGVQLHTRHARVFLQGALATGDFGLALGVRIVP